MSKLFLCILLAFVCLSTAAGQELATPSPAQTAVDSRVQQELTKKAEALLTETVQQARGLKNKENQILTRMAIADLFWKDHETVARGLYKEAFDNLHQAPAGADDSEPEATEADSSLSQLRERLLESLGRHDPMMARDFLRKTRLATSSNPTKPDTLATDAQTNSNDKSSDTRLELSLATEMVNESPKDAIRLAREALSDGYPYELISLLPKLAVKEPKAARELAVEIVNKLRKEDLSSNYDAVNTAMFMVGDAISSAKADKDGEDTEKQAPLLDPQSSRELIEFLTDAALKKQSGQSGMLLMSLRSVMNDLEQFAPVQATLLKQRFSEMGKAGADADPYRRFQQLAQANDTKAMLDLAGAAPPEVRDGLFGQAASLAWQQGDKAKANEIVTTKVSNPVERNRLLISFEDQTISELIEKQEFVQARQLIAQIRVSERRLQQLIELAAALAEKGDKKAAIEILQEAQGLMTGKPRNENQLGALLRIAGTFAELDADRSFAIIGLAIDQINELMAATALIANFGSMPMRIKDDEFAIEAYSPIPYGFAHLSSKDIRTLAQVDFNRTKEMFDRFQRPEIRIAAYLMMSRSILEPEPTADDCTCQERLKKAKGKTPKVSPYTLVGLEEVTPAALFRLLVRFWNRTFFQRLVYCAATRSHSS
jgi:hypothetical protein